MEVLDCYLELPYTANCIDDLKTLIQEVSDEHWIKYFNFDALPINHEQMIASDTFLQKLYNKYPFKCGIIRLKKNTYYDWHKDDNRGVSVNMLINDAHSHCMFRETNNITGNFTELKYKVGVYYLFNNQVEHSVINLDKDRYVFTLEFEQDKNTLTFDKIAKELW